MLLLGSQRCLSVVRCRHRLFNWHDLGSTLPVLSSSTRKEAPLQVNHVTKRNHSSLLHTIDQTLQMSTINPLYQGTHGLLDLIHSATGLPWWLSLIVTTLCIRTFISLPVAIAAQRNQAKLVNLKDELKAEAVSVSKAVKHAKWVHKLSARQYKYSQNESMKKLHRKFYEKHSVHPMKSLVITVTQLPIFVLFSLTLRNMSGYFGSSAEQGFCSEGGMWFRDLTLTDPTMALPIALGVVTLLNMRLSRMTNPAVSSLDQQSIRIERMMNITMLTLAVCLIPLSATQPSCIALYWLTTTSISLLHNLAFSVPALRRAFGIQKTPVEPDIRRLLKRN